MRLVPLLVATAVALRVPFDYRHAVVDRPVPIDALMAKAGVGFSMAHVNTKAVVNVTLDAWDNFEAGCLRSVAVLGTLAGGAPHPRCLRFERPASLGPDTDRNALLRQAGEEVCELDAEQAAAVHRLYATEGGLRDAFNHCLQTLGQNTRTAHVVFGSGDHLRLQFAKLGYHTGVPFVTLNHETTVGATLAGVGEWEARQTAVLQGFLRPGDVAVDVGAHIGTHAVAFAHSVYPGGVVHAFEAQPAVFEVLATNAHLAHTGNVLLHNSAVGYVPDGKGAASRLAVRRLNVKSKPNDGNGVSADTDDTNGNFGGLSLLGCLRERAVNGSGFATVDNPTPGVLDDTLLECHGRSGDSAAWDHVPLIQLDDMELYSSSRTCPRVIKFDVEGMEEEALLGASRTIRDCHPVLHVENNRVAASRRLIELVSGMGYRLLWDVARFYDPENYFRVPTVTLPEAVSRNLEVPFSPNLLCLPPGFDVSTVEPQTRLAMRYMTEATAAAPALGDLLTGAIEYMRPVLNVDWAVVGGQSPYGVDANVTRLYVTHPVFDFLTALQQV